MLLWVLGHVALSPVALSRTWHANHHQNLKKRRAWKWERELIIWKMVHHQWSIALRSFSMTAKAYLHRITGNIPRSPSCVMEEAELESDMQMEASSKDSTQEDQYTRSHPESPGSGKRNSFCTRCVGKAHDLPGWSQRVETPPRESGRSLKMIALSLHHRWWTGERKNTFESVIGH